MLCTLAGPVDHILGGLFNVSDHPLRLSIDLFVDSSDLLRRAAGNPMTTIVRACFGVSCAVAPEASLLHLG
jgi:hypothetical protein